MTNDADALEWTKRDRATHWLLMVLAVVSGVHFGAEVFDSIVNDPVWSSSITAARQWESTGVDPGSFYAIFSPLLLLLSIVTLAVGWKAKQSVRRWLRAATVLFIAAVAVTVAYFLPEIIQIRGTSASSIPDAELTRRIRQWILLDNGREVLVFLGFVMTLHALGLSYRVSGNGARES